MWNRLPLPDVEAVYFVVAGDEIEPDAVTAALGLTPDIALSPGECPESILAGLRQIFGDFVDDVTMPGHWSFSTRNHVAPGWIEPHLRYLLARLEPRAGALRTLGANAELRLSVQFARTPDGEFPAFAALHNAPSPTVLAALARLGITFESMSMPGGTGDDGRTDDSDDSDGEPWRG